MRGNAIVRSAVAAIGALTVAGAAHATNGYQLMGVGAYQKGMGGAVTSNPGSAMTAITNPAGMAAIGSRGDFSMELFMPERHADFSGSRGDKVESEAKAYGVPALGWTAPVTEGSDFYFGGGMYGTSGLGVDYAQTQFAPGTLPQGNPRWTDIQYSGYSSITYFQMAPTLAWKATDKLKAGVALNLDYQSVAFQQRITGDAGSAPGPLNSSFMLGRTANSFGYGLSAGVLYDVNDQITLGLSYKSKQNFQDLEYQLRENDIQSFPDGNGGMVNSQAGTYSMDLNYPRQVAGGITFTPIDRLEVSADVKWINWSDTMDDLAVTGDFVNRQGPTSQNAALDPGWDDQIVYAVGVDFTAIPKTLDLRAGFNYAESPIDQEDVFNNIVLPGVVETHASFGGTYHITKHWDFSFAFMKAFENSVTGKNDVPESYQGSFGESSGTEIDLSETSFTANLGYKF